MEEMLAQMLIAIMLLLIIPESLAKIVGYKKGVIRPFLKWIKVGGKKVLKKYYKKYRKMDWYYQVLIGVGIVLCFIYFAK
jgi:hypothetical protein